MSDSLARLLPPGRPPATVSVAAGAAARPSQLPRLPARLLHRPRLYRRLDQLAAVTLVEGGAGYGKTTLLASWLDDQPPGHQTVVWVTASAALDRADRFWSHLARRLAAVGIAAGGHDLPAGLDDALLGQPPGWRTVLVLDDFGHVRDPRILTDLVELARAHRSLRLCVASRGRHPIADPAAAALDVVEIAAGDLLLDEDETVAMARTLGKEVTAAPARWLRQVTGGWVAVTRAVLETAGPDEPLSAALDRCLDAYLSPSSGAGGGLRSLLAGRDGFDHPCALPELHARVARWYLAYGGPRDSLAALQHAAASGDSRLVIDIWSRHGMTLLPGAPAQLAAALSGLPEHVLATRPALRAAYRMATILGESSGPQAATGALRAYAEASGAQAGGAEAGGAEGQAADSDTTISEALFLATGRVVGWRLRGQLDRSVALADALDRRFARPEAPTDGLGDWLSWFHLQQGQTALAAGRDGEALAAWERTWLLSGADPRRAVPAYAVASLALVHALAGRVEPARRWLDEYWTLDRGDGHLSQLASVVAHLVLGWLALDRLDPPAVLGELERLAPAAPSELWPLLAALEAGHALHFGDPARGLERLDMAGAAHVGPAADPADPSGPAGPSGPGAFGAWLDRARIDLLLARGDLAGARQVLRRQPAPRAALRVPAARIHLLAGEYAAARGGGLREAWDHDLSPRDRVELLLIHSLASLRSGHGPSAAYLARQALELHLANPVLRPWATLGADERQEVLALAGGQLPADDAAVLAEQPPVYVGGQGAVELTRREQVVLSTLAKTGSRRDIANELYVSVNTVKVQLSSLYRKLGVSTRDAALTKARHLGLLPVTG